ncbi:hypothetical protein MMC25_008313 [Agyrium rufum]|nr:hypothetical protein [Agyrium rufum]
MTFFNSWALWEKLCFCLGIAITLTLFAGGVKLVYNHFQHRKHAAAASERKIELQEEITLPLPRIPEKRTRLNDVPFGVRAIESGIEVEGVWISRSNTPVPSYPATPKSPGSPQSHSTMDSLGKQHHHSPGSSASIASLPALDMPLSMRPDSRESNDQPANASTSSSPQPRPRSISPAARRPMRTRSPSEYRHGSRHNYRPRQSSHLRYSSADMLGPSEFTNENISRPARTGRRGSRSASPSSAEDSASEAYKPSMPKYAPSQTQQTGETGTLLPPKIPRADKPDRPSQYLPRNQSDSSLLQQYSPFPNPFTSPDSSPTDAKNPPSFQTFLETDPTRRGRQDVSPPTTSPVDGPGDSACNQSPPTEAYAPYNDERMMDPESQDQTSSAHGRHARRESEVIRKVNSGFEILRPGMLGTAAGMTTTVNPSSSHGHGARRDKRRVEKKAFHSRSASSSEDSMMGDGGDIGRGRAMEWNRDWERERERSEADL